jgi:hypothetical protein
MVTAQPKAGILALVRGCPPRNGPPRKGDMSSEFESINTGIAAHIGKYADDQTRAVFMLAAIPALVWPNIRVEVEVIAVRQPAA